MEADRSRKVGWQFWLGWMLASAAGFAAGMFTGILAGWSGDKPELLAMTIFSFLLGTGGGAGQWLVLRRRLVRTGGWVPATAAGFTLAGISMVLVRRNVSPLDGIMPEIAFIVVACIAPGVMQWLILRHQVVGAGWWLAASLAGTFIGVPLAVSAESLAESQQYLLFMTVAGALLGIGVGAIPGAVLVWILRQPGSRSAQGAATAAEATWLS